MKSLLLFLVASLGFSQTLALTGPATIPVGQTATLTLSLSAVPANLAGIQWTLAPIAGVSLGTPVASPLLAGGPSLYCSTVTGTCLIINTGTGTITLGNSAIASITVKPSAIGTLALPLTGLFAVSTSATAVTLTAGSFALTVTPSPCAYLGNATVTTADALALIQALLGQTNCSATFTPGCTLLNLEAVIIAANEGTCTLP